MSEIPYTPTDREMFDYYRHEQVKYNDQIAARAIDVFSAIQSFDDLKADPDWLPELETHGEELYYCVPSKLVLAQPHELTLPGEKSTVWRHVAMRLSLGYKRQQTETRSYAPAIQGLRRRSGRSSAMSILDELERRLTGEEARDWRRTFAQFDHIPTPDMIEVKLNVAGTGDHEVDDRAGGSVFDHRTVSGLSIPLLKWGKDHTYFTSDTAFSDYASLQDNFLTEEMIETHEKRMLTFAGLLDGIAEVLEDQELNPRGY